MRVCLVVALLAHTLMAVAVAQTPDGFRMWRRNFTADMIKDGADPVSIHALIDPIQFDPGVIPPVSSGFAPPVRDYIVTVLAPARLARGRQALFEHANLLTAIEARYGVDRAAIVAVWGMETEFGGVRLDHDALRTLATRAYAGPRRRYFESQLRVLIELLLTRSLDRGQLASSSDGGLGQPQFMPDTFVRLAVDWDGDGRRDIWNSDADALASIANVLARSGWRLNEPLFDAVFLEHPIRPQQLKSQSVAEWIALGVNVADSDRKRALAATLYQPDGSDGQALLGYQNFEALRRYNGAHRYALAASLMIEALDGSERSGEVWPGAPGELALSDIRRLQSCLAVLGYDPGAIDGYFGVRTWRAMNAFLRAIDRPPAQWPTQTILRLAEAASTPEARE